MWWLWLQLGTAVVLVIAGLSTPPKGRWATIKDYDSMSDYLDSGCPYREVARQLLWWIGIKDKGRNDALSLLGLVVLFVGPWICLLRPSVPGPWWFWLLWHPIIILEGYGPMGGVGEWFHGDPVRED